MRSLSTHLCLCFFDQLHLLCAEGTGSCWHKLLTKCKEVSPTVVQLLPKRLRDECEQLCSRCRKGMLSSLTPSDLQLFNWLLLADDLKHETPILFEVLLAAGAPPHPRNVHKGVSEESFNSAICTAAAVLLKDFMSALQHLLGIILFHFNASKQVSPATKELQLINDFSI